MTIDGIQYMCQSAELERLACRTPRHLLGYEYDSHRCHRTANRPFGGQIQHALWLKYGLVWAISLGGKNRGLRRSVVGNSEHDWAGAGVETVEVEQAEEHAAAGTVTEVKVDKVLALELPLSLTYAHSRTSQQPRQTADHREEGQ